jgi:hypothetical protein
MAAFRKNATPTTLRVFLPIIAAVTGLDNIAALVGSRSPAIGLLVHFLSSGLIGISSGLLFERESPDLPAGIAWGLLYGLVWRFAGSLTFFPILQGLSFTWTRNAAANALPSMVGHLILRDCNRRGLPSLRTPSSQLAAIGSPFRGERGTPSQADRDTGSSTLVVCLCRWNTAPNCFDVINFCRVTFLSRKAGNCLRSKRYPSLPLFRLASRA